MKNLTYKNLYKYTKNKQLKNDLKTYWNYSYLLNKNDFEILKNQWFKNCFFYSTYDEKLDKTYYIMYLFTKKIYKSYKQLNNDFWKFTNCYYFYKLKEYNNVKNFILYKNN